MPNARKACLLFAMTLVAMALGASSASAQESILFYEEVGMAACEPCDVHFVGESELHTHAFGFEVVESACTDEFEGQVVEEIEEGEQGHLYVYENNAASSASCQLIGCNGVGEPAWAAEWSLYEILEVAMNETTLTVDFCFDDKANPNGTGLICPAEAHLEEQVADNHVYVLFVDVVCDNMNFIGEWQTEAETSLHDAIEMVHL
jgi:hypothetical protein